MLHKRILPLIFAFGLLYAQSSNVDIPVVLNSGGLYPNGQTAAKNGDSIRFFVKVSPPDVDSVIVYAPNIVDTLNYSGNARYIVLYDDGSHGDSLPNDGFYASELLPVRARTAFNRFAIRVINDTFRLIAFGKIGVDNFQPFIGDHHNVLYPAGQTAVKTGDKVRIISYIDDVSSYVDVSFMVDNSGSMADTPSGDDKSKLDAAKLAIDTFLTRMADSDRAALWTFYGGSWSVPSEETLKVALTYDKQEVMDSVNALHPYTWTPLYDATYEATMYVDSLSDRIAVAIILTDGVDDGPGSGTGDGSNEYTREDCYFLPIPVFTIGFGDTADIDTAFLDSVALTSGGKFYIAPNSAQLDSIYREIQTIIARMSAPKGIALAWANGTPVGADSIIAFFDDGDHEDNNYNDSIWGTSLFTINVPAGFNDSVAIQFYAKDVAGNITSAIQYIKIDNLPPIADSLMVTYPAGKNVVHNGEKVYFTIKAADTGKIAGIKEVYLDATQIGGPSYVIMRDDGTGNDAVAGDGIYTSDSIEVNTSTYSGTAPVYAYVVDIAGNITSKAGGVLVDNIPPEITDIRKIFPQGQSAVKQGDTIIITAEITDDLSGVDSVYIEASDLTGGNFLMRDDGNGYDENAQDNVYTYAGEVSSTATGNVNVRIIAVDREGNRDTVDFTVPVDNTPPNPSFSFVVLDPDNIYSNGEYVHIRVINTGETGLRVSANFSNIDSYYIPGSETWTDNGDGTYDIVYRISENNTRADGSYAIPITLYDGANNSSSHNLILRLDNHPVIVDTIYLADEDRIINSNDTVYAVLHDNEGVSKAEYFIDAPATSGTGISLTLDNPGNDSVNGYAVLDISILEEGAHKIYLHGRDTAGLWGSFKTLDFVIDRTAPVITNIQVIYPEGKVAVRDGDTVHIVARIYDEVSGVDSVWLNGYELNGDSVIVMYDDGSHGDGYAGDGIYTAEVVMNTGGYSGERGFEIHAIDRVPNERVISGVVRVDNSVPSGLMITILDPDNIYRNGEEVHLRVSTDSSGYEVRVDFSEIDSRYVSGSEVVVDNGDGSYDVRYLISESNERADGSYYVRATVIDGAGNITTDSVLLVLDNTGASVLNIHFALDPRNDSILNNPDTIIALAIDNIGVKAAEYFIDNTDGHVISVPMTLDNPGADTTVIRGYLDITKYTEGHHTIYIRAQDSSGAWGEFGSMEFIIDTSAPLIDNVRVIYPLGQDAARDSQIIKIVALIKDRITRVDPATVILDASNINGDSAVLMYDDGTHGDEVAGDHIYTAEIMVNNGVSGEYGFTITASDIVPNTRTVSGTVKTDNGMPTIAVSYSPEPKNGNEVYQDRILLTVAVSDSPVSGNIKKVVFDVYNSNGDIVYHKDVNKVPEELRFKEELPLVPGFNRIRVRAYDFVGNMVEYNDTITYIVPEVSNVIGEEGGTISAPDGAKLIIPAGAVLENTEFKIKTLPTSLFPPPLDKNVVLLGTVHEILPHGIDFHEPATLILPYTSYELDPDHDGVMDFAPESLTVFYYDGQDWVKVGDAEVDTVNKTVSVVVNHLSVFALGVDRRPLPQKFLVYLTKNPFRLDEGTTIVYQAPAPGKITIKIYDLNGDLIRTIVKDARVPRAGEYSVKWYGRSDHNLFHGSGLYIYVIEYESDDGQFKASIKKPIGIIK